MTIPKYFCPVCTGVMRFAGDACSDECAVTLRLAMGPMGEEAPNEPAIRHVGPRGKPFYALGFGPLCLRDNQLMAHTRPQFHCWLKRLILLPLEGLMVIDIRVGQRSHLGNANPIPAKGLLAFALDEPVIVAQDIVLYFQRSEVLTHRDDTLHARAFALVQEVEVPWENVSGPMGTLRTDSSKD